MHNTMVSVIIAVDTARVSFEYVSVTGTACRLPYVVLRSASRYPLQTILSVPLQEKL